MLTAIIFDIFVFNEKTHDFYYKGRNMTRRENCESLNRGKSLKEAKVSIWHWMNLKFK